MRAGRICAFVTACMCVHFWMSMTVWWGCYPVSSAASSYLKLCAGTEQSGMKRGWISNELPTTSVCFLNFLHNYTSTVGIGLLSQRHFIWSLVNGSWNIKSPVVDLDVWPSPCIVHQNTPVFAFHISVSDREDGWVYLLLVFLPHPPTPHARKQDLHWTWVDNWFLYIDLALSECPIRYRINISSTYDEKWYLSSYFFLHLSAEGLDQVPKCLSESSTCSYNNLLESEL